MAEFMDREHYFRTIYGDNPMAEHYRGYGPEPDSRIAYREILRLRDKIEALEALDECRHVMFCNCTI